MGVVVCTSHPRNNGKCKRIKVQAVLGKKALSSKIIREKRVEVWFKW
jgi:hypothetical protein